MADKVILTRKENRIGFITLNRPEAMNTFIPEFAAQLDQALWDMENDDDIMVVVINAAGKHFCTGISLDQFHSKTHKEYRDFLYGIDAFYHTLAKMKKLTIASVQGLPAGRELSGVPGRSPRGLSAAPHDPSSRETQVGGGMLYR